MSTIAIAPAVAHEDHDDNEGGGTYLAIGDSIAAGTQQPLPFTSNGYTNVLFEELQDEYGFETFLNLGCPADDTREVINADDNPAGGSICYGSGAFLAPGSTGGSQLDVALAYIAANPGEVRLITITLGANDIFRCTDLTNVLCLIGEITNMAGGLATILATLRAADPTIPIIGMNYYNSSLGYWPEDPAFAEASQGLVPAFNGALEAVYGAFGVPVADVESAFKTFKTNGTPQKNYKAICKYSRMCEKVGSGYIMSDWTADDYPGPDVHPTNKGYTKIAGTFEELIEDLGLFEDAEDDEDDD